MASSSSKLWMLALKDPGSTLKASPELPVPEHALKASPELPVPEHTLKASPELPVPEHDIASVSCCKECLSIVTEDGTVFTSKVKYGNVTEWKQPSGLSQHHVISVQSGSSHHVALTTDRKLLAWGKNDCGQLGRGKTGTRNDTKSKKTNTASGKRDTSFNASVITSIQNIKIHQVSCGNSHTLCLSENGQVYTWGANDCGQLGLRRDSSSCSWDTNSYCNVPNLASDLQNVHIVQISAGGRHSVVVSASGVVYCWGSNLYGQLGLKANSDGENTNDKQKIQWTPLKCQAVAMEKVDSISCGENHTAFRTWTGCVLTCGMGSSGQLGHSSMDNEFLPRQITGELDSNVVTQIACGTDYTTAHVQSTNTIYVYGAGRSWRNNLPEGLDNPSLLCGEEFLYIFQPCSVSNDEEEDGEYNCIPSSTEKSQLLTLDLILDNLMNKKTPLNTGDKKVVGHLLEKALSQAACVNGSFILKQDEEHSEFTHDVDLEAADIFFQEITKASLSKIAEKSVKQLLKNFHLHPASEPESLRLFVFLPCCLYGDRDVFSEDVVTSFANSIIELSDELKYILGNWLANIPKGYFKRYVRIFKKCVTICIKKLRTASGNTPKSQFSEIERCVEPCIQVLDILNETNKRRREPIHHRGFYIKDLTDIINIQGDFNARLQDIDIKKQSAFRFCKYPFLYDSASKMLLLKCQCQKVITNSGVLYLTVRREHVVEDARDWFSTHEYSLHKRLDVMFWDENESSGVGIRQEFFEILFENLLSEKFGAFHFDVDSKVQWFKKGSDLDDIYFVGLMCGLALYQGFILPLKFPNALYKKLLNKHLVFKDLLSLKPQLGLGLENLVKLCPSAADILETQDNKEDGVNKLTDYYLNTSIAPEFESFRKGFFKSMPEDLLNNFHSKELKEILVGNKRYDFKALERVTVYGPDYHKDHKTIKLFWEIIHAMKLDDQKNFLKYMWSTDRIPASGMKRMEMKVMPREEPGENPNFLLPHAVTCFNILKLPKYTDKEMMEQKLLMATYLCTGFDLP